MHQLPQNVTVETVIMFPEQDIRDATFSPYLFNPLIGCFIGVLSVALFCRSYIGYPIGI